MPYSVIKLVNKCANKTCEMKDLTFKNRNMKSFAFANDNLDKYLEEDEPAKEVVYPVILVEKPGVDLKEFVSTPMNAVTELSEEEDFAMQVAEAMEAVSLNNFILAKDGSEDVIEITSDDKDNNGSNSESGDDDDNIKKMEPLPREITPICDVYCGDDVTSGYKNKGQIIGQLKYGMPPDHINGMTS